MTTGSRYCEVTFDEAMDVCRELDAETEAALDGEAREIREEMEARRGDDEYADYGDIGVTCPKHLYPLGSEIERNW